ncbi:MAG: FAD synthase [Candidatus Andersenbacteria bacterium CG10_big_fil_rev_8_21_14_0_10_54_11]|uniref:FAD synthase n=1 Tax=Candidatus Andersenbacteria bacterium CG10_big_fil_rev_8_21_14_0_10_54_11 TaxID=1974485 RepID=A0A2M6X0D3_9BACT|nr:MAG: FAD synthase [Candidatus Andersenbacteria bacterium CG10_big_fil_rev_8_21_14_0_10_54_11]
MPRVLAFGSFDPLHNGHRDFFRQARLAGDPDTHLTVVVAADSFLRCVKQKEPQQPAAVRLAAVRADPFVDAACLGDTWPTADPYRLLETLDFDVLAVGYDQRPDDAVIAAELARRGKKAVRLVRCRPFQPERYKSSYFRRG